MTAIATAAAAAAAVGPTAFLSLPSRALRRHGRSEAVAADALRLSCMLPLCCGAGGDKEEGEAAKIAAVDDIEHARASGSDRESASETAEQETCIDVDSDSDAVADVDGVASVDNAIVSHKKVPKPRQSARSLRRAAQESEHSQNDGSRADAAVSVDICSDEGLEKQLGDRIADLLVAVYKVHNQRKVPDVPALVEEVCTALTNCTVALLGSHV
jgi:hypothetical protein